MRYGTPSSALRGSMADGASIPRTDGVLWLIQGSVIDLSRSRSTHERIRWGMLGASEAFTSLTSAGGVQMVGDDFYEYDEPLEEIRALQETPYDLVTAPPGPRAVTVNWFPTTGADWQALTPSGVGEPACR